MRVRSVNNSRFDMVTDTDNPRNKAVRLAEKMLKKVQTDLPDSFEMPPVAVVDFEKQGLNANAIGGFHEASGRLFINSRYDTRQKILDFVNNTEGYFANKTEYEPYLHELGHKFYYDTIKSIAREKQIGYTKAQGITDACIYEYLHEKLLEGKSIGSLLSEYANSGYKAQLYTEVIAESFSVKNINSVASDLIKLLEKEVKRK